MESAVAVLVSGKKPAELKPGWMLMLPGGYFGVAEAAKAPRDKAKRKKLLLSDVKRASVVEETVQERTMKLLRLEMGPKIKLGLGNVPDNQALLHIEPEKRRLAWLNILQPSNPEKIQMAMYTTIRESIDLCLNTEGDVETLETALRLMREDEKNRKDKVKFGENEMVLPEARLATMLLVQGRAAVVEDKLTGQTLLRKQGLLLLAIRHMLTMLPRPLLQNRKVVDHWIEAGQEVNQVRKVMEMEVPAAYRDIWGDICILCAHLYDQTVKERREEVIGIFVDVFGGAMLGEDMKYALRGKPGAKRTSKFDKLEAALEFMMHMRHDILSSLPTYAFEAGNEDEKEHEGAVEEMERALLSSPSLTAQMYIGILNEMEKTEADSRQWHDALIRLCTTLEQREVDLLNLRDTMERRCDDYRSKLDEAIGQLQKKDDVISQLHLMLKSRVDESLEIRREAERRMSNPMPRLQEQAIEAVRLTTQQGQSLRNALTLDSLKTLPVTMMRVPLVLTRQTLQAMSEAFPKQTQPLNVLFHDIGSIAHKPNVSADDMMSLAGKAMWVPLMTTAAATRIAVDLAKSAMIKATSVMLPAPSELK